MQAERTCIVVRQRAAAAIGWLLDAVSVGIACPAALSCGPGLHVLRPLIFVLEEHERVLPGLLLLPLRPRAQRRRVVIGPSQAHIAPVRGRHDRNFKVALGIGDGQRDGAEGQASRRSRSTAGCSVNVFATRQF